MMLQLPSLHGLSSSLKVHIGKPPGSLNGQRLRTSTFKK